MSELIACGYVVTVLIVWVVLSRIDYDQLGAGLHLLFAVMWPMFLPVWVAVWCAPILEETAEWIRSVGKPRSRNLGPYRTMVEPPRPFPPPLRKPAVEDCGCPIEPEEVDQQ